MGEDSGPSNMNLKQSHELLQPTITKPQKGWKWWENVRRMYAADRIRLSKVGLLKWSFSKIFVDNFATDPTLGINQTLDNSKFLGRGLISGRDIQWGDVWRLLLGYHLTQGFTAASPFRAFIMTPLKLAVLPFVLLDCLGMIAMNTARENMNASTFGTGKILWGLLASVAGVVHFSAKFIYLLGRAGISERQAALQARSVAPPFEWVVRLIITPLVRTLVVAPLGVLSLVSLVAYIPVVGPALTSVLQITANYVNNVAFKYLSFGAGKLLNVLPQVNITQAIVTVGVMVGSFLSVVGPLVEFFQGSSKYKTKSNSAPNNRHSSESSVDEGSSNSRSYSYASEMQKSASSNYILLKQALYPEVSFDNSNQSSGNSNNQINALLSAVHDGKPTEKPVVVIQNSTDLTLPRQDPHSFLWQEKNGAQNKSRDGSTATVSLTPSSSLDEISTPELH